MIVIVFNLLWIFSRNCLVVYHCTCSWSIAKSFTIDSFVTNSMYQKHRGRRKAYRIENAASRDASTTWKNWVSIVKKQNSWHMSMELCLCNTLKTSRVSFFKGPFCKVVTDLHIMWNWGGGGGGGHDLLWMCGSIHVCPTKRSHVWSVCCHVLCDRLLWK